MSGGAHCPGLEALGLDLLTFDNSAISYNPLHCLICQELMQNPSSLPCRHVFCSRCLESLKASHDHFRCPVCSAVVSSSSTFAEDPLVCYLLDIASEKADTCANCDQAKQPMYFCDTCQQPLCSQCKEKTHQARMFSTHKIIPLEERSSGRDSDANHCEVHNEPFILFSTDTKSLRCINCFRNATMDTRPHFLDLNVAHEIGCEKLEHVAKKFKRFQGELSDSLLMHRSFLDEVQRNAASEKVSIQQHCQQIIDKIMEIRDHQIQLVELELKEKDEYCRKVLKQQLSLFPTVQLYLLMASIFASSVAKLDFLRLGYTLMSRIGSIMSENQDHDPKPSSQIQSNYKQEISRALESFIGLKSVYLPGVALSSSEKGISAVLHQSSGELSPASSIGSCAYAHKCKHAARLQVQRLKAAWSDTASSSFSEDFMRLTMALNAINTRFLQIQSGAQELQRDLTVRRCVVERERLDKLVSACDLFAEDIGQHMGDVEALDPVFRKMWEEQLEKIQLQRDSYQTHFSRVLRLRDDSGRIRLILNQIEPLLASITLAIQAICPKRRPDNEPPGPMAEICLQITTLEPNSEQRLDAIEREERNRKTMQEQAKQKTMEDQKGHRKKLRTARDHPRRKSNLEGCSNNVVKEVGRERDTRSLFLSPGGSFRLPKRAAGSDSATSSVGLPSPVGSVVSSCVDESLDEESKSEPPVPDEATCTATSSIAEEEALEESSLPVVPDCPQFLLENAPNPLQFLMEGAPKTSPSSSEAPSPVKSDGPTATCTGTVTQNDDRPTDAHVAQSAEKCETANPPRKESRKRIPADICRTVGAGDLDAKERLLESLKQKVKRVDIGPPSKTPERDIEKAEE